jgi:hypothetical protein
LLLLHGLHQGRDQVRVAQRQRALRVGADAEQAVAVAEQRLDVLSEEPHVGAAVAVAHGEGNRPQRQDEVAPEIEVADVRLVPGVGEVRPRHVAADLGHEGVADPDVVGRVDECVVTDGGGVGEVGCSSVGCGTDKGVAGTGAVGHACRIADRGVHLSRGVGGQGPTAACCVVVARRIGRQAVSANGRVPRAVPCLCAAHREVARPGPQEGVPRIDAWAESVEETGVSEEHHAGRAASRCRRQPQVGGQIELLSGSRRADPER